MSSFSFIRWGSWSPDKFCGFSLTQLVNIAGLGLGHRSEASRISPTGCSTLLIMLLSLACGYGFWVDWCPGFVSRSGLQTQVSQPVLPPTSSGRTRTPGALAKTWRSSWEILRERYGHSFYQHHYHVHFRVHHASVISLQKSKWLLLKSDQGCHVIQGDADFRCGDAVWVSEPWLVTAEAPWAWPSRCLHAHGCVPLAASFTRLVFSKMEIRQYKWTNINIMRATEMRQSWEVLGTASGL